MMRHPLLSPCFTPLSNLARRVAFFLFLTCTCLFVCLLVRRTFIPPFSASHTLACRWPASLTFASTCISPCSLLSYCPEFHRLIKLLTLFPLFPAPPSSSPSSFSLACAPYRVPLTTRSPSSLSRVGVTLLSGFGPPAPLTRVLIPPTTGRGLGWMTGGGCCCWVPGVETDEVRSRVELGNA